MLVMKTRKSFVRKLATGFRRRFLSYLNEAKMKIEDFTISAKSLSELLILLFANKITGKSAKDIFKEMLKTKESPSKIVARKGLKKVDDPEKVNQIVQQVIRDFPDAASDYKGGTDKSLGFLVGQAMKISKGQADPVLVTKFIKEKLRS